MQNENVSTKLRLCYHKLFILEVRHVYGCKFRENILNFQIFRQKSDEGYRNDYTENLFSTNKKR